MRTSLNSKKNCLHFNYTLCLFFVLITFNVKTQAQSQKPNIIFILGDDVGYKTFSFNGGQSFNTPNLDSMAATGMNFTECHSTPLCSPSRVMLLTGKYNFRNYTAWGIMDTGQKTIANMLKNAGYATGCFGKWQLDGGDASIKKFGFDNYCVWLPFASEEPARYKNPVLYTNGEYIPDSLVQNKYGEDIVADSLISFIEKNKSAPFFIYYPMLLAHPPFQPTPEDTAAFAAWSFPKRSDTSFYTSMIKYMDEKIGAIINKLKQSGLSNNTVIIYVGDNGTPAEITQQTNDGANVGGKDSTTEAGTHVPMIIDWPKIIKPGTVNNDLIGFTDFLPTLAHIAGITEPVDYGPLDGVDFYPRLKGNQGTPRDWLFYDFIAHPGLDSLKRWAQTKEYKLYDTSLYNSNRFFYNILKDPNELDPLEHDVLTPEELSIKQELLSVIQGYVKQGTPILGNAYVSNITNSSVILNDSVKVNGGSTIKADGAVWNNEPNADISTSQHTSNGTLTGAFKSLIKELKANAVYYVRAYAKNIGGVSYSNEIKFKTLLNTPQAFAATAIDNNTFTANWNSINAASGYKIDVSTKPLFAVITQLGINQQFNNGLTPPAGWTFTGSIGVNDTIHKQSSPALQFKAPNAQIITRQLDGPATQLKFWIKGLNTDTLSFLRVEGFDGNAWKLIKNIQPLPATGVVKTFGSASSTPLENDFIQFRFTYLKSIGTLAFDDVVISYNKIDSSFVPGYHALKVKDTSTIISGLQADKNYYYRVRAITSDNTSANSNVIAATTCSVPNCNASIAELFTHKLNIVVFPNPTSKDFTLVVLNNKNKQIEITVIDAIGRVVYQSNGFGNKVVFGKSFSSGVYFAHVLEDGNATTLKLVKE